MKNNLKNKIGYSVTALLVISILIQIFTKIPNKTTYVAFGSIIFFLYWVIRLFFIELK